MWQEDSPRPDTKNPSRRTQKNHPKTHIIHDKNVGVSTRRKLNFNEQYLLSIVELKNFTEASKNIERVKSCWFIGQYREGGGVNEYCKPFTILTTFKYIIRNT